MEYVQPRPLAVVPKIPIPDCASYGDRVPPKILAADGTVHTCLALDREVAVAEQQVRLAIEAVLDGLTSSRQAQRRVTAMLTRQCRFVNAEAFVAAAFDEWRASS